MQYTKWTQIKIIHFLFLFLEREEFSNLLSLHVHKHFNLTQKGVCFFLSSNHLKALKFFKENKLNCIIVKKKMLNQMPVESCY